MLADRAAPSMMGPTTSQVFIESRTDSRIGLDRFRPAPIESSEHVSDLRSCGWSDIYVPARSTRWRTRLLVNVLPREHDQASSFGPCDAAMVAIDSGGGRPGDRRRAHDPVDPYPRRRTAA